MLIYDAPVTENSPKKKFLQTFLRISIHFCDNAKKWSEQEFSLTKLLSCKRERALAAQHTVFTLVDRGRSSEHILVCWQSLKHVSVCLNYSKARTQKKSKQNTVYAIAKIKQK